MRIIRQALHAGILLLCIGCTTEKGSRIESEVTITLEDQELEVHEIDEILKPVDMSFTDNYTCILSEENTNSEQVFVYDSNTLDYKYKFAKRGNGPQETIALDIIKKSHGDTITLIDQANYKVLSYELTDKEPILLDEQYLKLRNAGPLQESYWVNDTSIVFSTLSGELKLYSTESESIIDEINVSGLIDGLPDEYAKKLDGFSFSFEKGEILLGFRCLNAKLRGRINNGKIEIYKDSEQPLSIDTTLGKDMYDMPVFNAYVELGPRYAIAQYYGYKLKEMQTFPMNLNGQNLHYDLEVYTNDMVPIGKLSPEFDILRSFIDNERKRLYVIEAFQDFDAIKFYNLP